MRSLFAVTCAALLLAGCSTVSDLNPFGGDGSRRDPNAPPEEDRISILQFEQQLEVADNTAPVTLPPAYVNTVWPQAEGYPTHNLQHTQATGSLSVAWRRSFGSGSARSRRINARPVIADGRVYVVDSEGKVVAMDAETGQEIWTHRLRSESRRDRMSFGGGLGFDSGRLYVHSGFRFMVALDAATGTEVWRTTADTPFQSAPTINAGRVFITTDDNQLYAFDSNTGEFLWSHQGIIESARLLTGASPAVLGDLVVAPYSSGEVVAIRVQNGNPVWSDSLTRAGGLTPISAINDVAGSPVMTEDNVYALSHSGTLVSLDMRSGERQWTLPAGGLNAPWIAGDYLFLVTVEGEVICVDRTVGEVRWITRLRVFEHETRRRNRISWVGPVLAGGRLFLTSSTGDSVIIDAATGDIERDFSLRDPVFVAPVIANETIYVVTDEGRLIALR
jgi:outer membrane protein assembly factor BamB